MNNFTFRFKRVALVGVLGLILACGLLHLVVQKMVRRQEDMVESNVKQEFAVLAKHIYQAKMHVRGSKTSDSLTKAIGVLKKVLKKLDIDINSVNERAVLQPKSVCPEEFKGTTFGYPFFYKGWEMTECDYSKRIETLVTIVVYISSDNAKSTFQKVEKFLESVFQENNRYKVNVAAHLAGEDANVLIEQFPGVKLTNVEQNVASGLAWNKIIASVDTPYTLVARNVEILTNDSRLERLVRVTETLNVAVAASAYRTPDGHWKNGCYQTAYKNYTLVYVEGYDVSMHECLFCDYTLGPFVVSTSLIKKHKFKEFNESSGMYEDWFLRLQHQGLETLVCPDAMFHTTYMLPSKPNWSKFMQEWELYKVKTPYRETIVSKCDGANSLGFQRSMGLSPCLLKENADVINFIMKSCEDENIICELQEGSALGAMKFNKILPWERDGDLAVLTANYSAFQALREKTTAAGYKFQDLGSLWCCVDNRTAGGKFAIKSNVWNIELYGQHLMDTELLMMQGVNPTKVLLDGKWVNVPRNPGLFVRNRYGREIYQHALHWMTTGDKTGWIDYKTNRFMKCDNPGHHACLDRFNADGSIAFSDPLP